MNIIYFDLYDTVTKNRDEKEEEDDNNGDYLYNSIIVPNYDIGIKPRGTILR